MLLDMHYSRPALTEAPVPRGGSDEASFYDSRESSRTLPPVVLLGGEANALSVARDLGRMGVRVYAIGASDSCVRHSRYVRWIDVPVENGAEESWARFLLGSESDPLRGAVVLSCSDDAIQLLAHHREALQKKFLLDDSSPEAQLQVLDKLSTYRHAASAGVCTPRFWEIADRQSLREIERELVFPLLVKPRLSHLFEARFGRKHVIVHSSEELQRAFEGASDAGMDVLLMEWIPGGDDRLCSYYTYLDEQSRPLFHFTKRIIRRYPNGMGAACYHITDEIPELIRPANRLFRHVGLRGLANVEFKHDPRDGQYKLIECNARFTASNCLVSASGVNLAAFVYNRLIGRPTRVPAAYRSGLRLWDPVRDYWAFQERRAAREITLARWIGSILHRQTFCFFKLTDPLPALARLAKPMRRWLEERHPT